MLFFFVPIVAGSQILNGSFEQYSTMPVNMGQWQVVNGWENAGSFISSPDFYHNNGTEQTNLPETPFALVHPYHGNAVMGLIACGKQNTNVREYISTQLSVPLIIGQKYIVGLKITNGEKTATSLAGIGVDQLGLLFSVGPIIQTDQNPIFETPQLKIESVLYTDEWRSYNFEFTATAASTHLTFGLFGSDDDKQITIVEGADPQFAYYFLDGVTMDKVEDGFSHIPNVKETPVNSTVGGYHPNSLGVDQPFFIPNTFTPDGDGNNDVFKPIPNTIKEWEFEIFNKWGGRVFFTTDENKGWDGTCGGVYCENGSYVWQISYIDLDDQHRQRWVETKGIINLVR